MSERSESHYDGTTPSDRLVRYKWSLSGEDSRIGEERADDLYATALLKLDDLLESQGVGSSHERNVILGGVVPGPYDLYGGSSRFDDWLDMLRLIPVRLLQREFPQLESYTTRYITELFDTALPEDSKHGMNCIGSDPEREACDKADVCPARVLREVSLRQLGLLIFDRHTYDKSATSDLEHVNDMIDGFSYHLTNYRLIDERTLVVITDEMNTVAHDFFVAISEPRHRRED